jgi:hypothetical protein
MKNHLEPLHLQKYRSLRIPWAYQDLGPDYFRRQDKEQQARRFVRQLEALGYRVELAPQEEVTA